MEHDEDQDSLFGSPPPSPRIPWALSLPSASICDNERRLSTSTDTQNVGTIALPGSHLYSELPLNPLALSLNHTTVHRPPAQSQGQPTTAANQNIQPWQLPPAQNKGSKNSRSSKSPFSNVPSRDPSRGPEFSLPDPSAPPPAHFLRNQQNLLGKAGLVAGVKPSTITHIRGASSFNPIVIDDDDTPILGRQSQSKDSRHLSVDPSLLAAPTNEDIVSVLMAQKDIFPVLEGILGIIGKGATRPYSTTSFLSWNDSSKNPPPIKKRKLYRVPAGAADWDVPYPFKAGDGPDEYYKTWERKRANDLVAQLVKLIKLAARKAAIKNHLRKDESRQAIWERLIKSEPQKPQSQPPPPPSQVSFDSIISSLVAAQPGLTSSQTSMSGLDDLISTMGNNNIDNMGESSSASNTAAIPDDLDALISSMLNSLPQDHQGIGTTPVPSSSSSSQQPSLIGDEMIDPTLLALSVQPGSDENLSSMSSQAVSPVPSMSSSSGVGPMTPTLSAAAWEPDIFTGFGGQGVLFRPTLWNEFSQGAYQGFTTEGGGWDETGQITSYFTSGVTEEGGNVTPMVVGEGRGKGKGKEVLRTNPLGFSSADATPQIPYNTLMATQQSTDVVQRPYEQPPEHPTPVLAPRADIVQPSYEQPEPPTPVPRAPPRPKISQSRKEEILRRAREKQREVREELDRVKTQLWETTIEQAALVHLLKRFEND